MKTPKTLFLIECRACKGSYYGGDTKLVLHPGNENEQPDEISFVIRKVSKCSTCKQLSERQRGHKGGGKDGWTGTIR